MITGTENGLVHDLLFHIGTDTFDHVWRLRKYLPERHGQPCRVCAASVGPGPRNIRVEFPDGFWVITSRWAVRKST